ncbi:hypothetical protein ACIRBX_02280 [Kitasatospora sp. NPDC096147]|uniref:hypothetical protein n=1 Tax=Kitasatospora sp. NPDC096147 TaxID=3364093 RepID=UPI00381FD3C1
MIEDLPAGDGEPDGLLLAGYFVAVPASSNGSAVPRRPGLTTASDCRAERLPEDGRWFASAPEALAACRLLPVPEGARLYALLVPSGHADGLTADIRADGTDEPVLLGNLGRHCRVPAGELAEGGREIGWEVLSYDLGQVHTWLCNDLQQDGARELGVTTDPDRVLLPDREAAALVAAWANARGDTPGTWYPAALIEWESPVVGRESTGADAPTPVGSRPWWRRIF